MFRWAFILILLLSTATTAQAENLESWCKKEFKKFGDLNRCVQQNKSAKSRLERDKNKYDADAYQFCLDEIPKPLWRERLECVVEEELAKERIPPLRKVVGEEYYNECLRVVPVGDWFGLEKCLMEDPVSYD